MSKLALQLIAENKKTRATFLDLGRCGLTKIPENVKELVWLEELSFSKYYWNGEQWLASQNRGKANKIGDLTPLSGLIKSGLEVTWSSSWWEGNGIYVEGCPLKNPPESIIRQGNQAILNYFKEKQEQGTDHLYEAKLLIVGAGGAGKTSLVRRLYQTAKDLPEEKETTKGIDVYQHIFPIKDKLNGQDREFRLNVWDFAGQEKYRPADTFFFTQRSLYVLLDDTRTDDKTLHDAGFKYWLEAIDCFSDNSPVLIFQNEKSGRSKSIDLAGIKARFENVKESYAGNLEHENAADKLREAIEFFAKSLPHIGEELPAKWINIRSDIEQVAKQQATISQQDYLKKTCHLTVTKLYI